MDTNTILKSVSKGRDLSTDEFCYLYEQTSDDKEILALANELNLSKNKNFVTFIHNRNVNYTNICLNYCLFCGFRRSSQDQGSYFLSIEEIIRRLSETPEISEVCIQGGLFPGLDFFYILDMLKEIKANFPKIHIHAFSPMEIYYFSLKSGYRLIRVLEALVESGLGSVPGTAAEILDDRLRSRICPEKINTANWIKTIKIIHNYGIKSTATILFGHVENTLQLARHLQILRDIQYETHGFTEFIPLPFVPMNTPLSLKNGNREMIPFRRIRLFYALSRIFFNNSIPNIQSSWPKIGLDRAIECTFYGVNDIGGTLYQENITKSAGGTHGEMVRLSKFQYKLRAVEKIPQLRNTLYEPQDSKLLADLIKLENLDGT